MPQHSSVLVSATPLSWMGAWGSPTAKPSRAWGTVPDSQRRCRFFERFSRWVDGCVPLPRKVGQHLFFHDITSFIQGLNYTPNQSNIVQSFGVGPRYWFKSLYRKLTKKERAKFKAASEALKVTKKTKRLMVPHQCLHLRCVLHQER